MPTSPNAAPPGSAPASDDVHRLRREEGATLAYRRTPGNGPGAALPGILFLGGFRSDMNGQKALALEAACRARGQAFLRFDYRGHGVSDGDFAALTIGDWAADACLVLDRVTEGRQILVGSSMGGWLALLTALARPDRVAALVGIAAAPDFTEDLLWPRLTPGQQREMTETGSVRLPSAYDPAGYLMTRRLVEEGREHLIMRSEIALDCPVRLLHGMRDPDVPYETSLRLAERLRSRDVAVELLKEGDHRLSTEADLARLCRVVAELSEQLR